MTRAEKYAAQKAAGICIRCSRNPAVPGKQKKQALYCVTCYNKHDLGIKKKIRNTRLTTRQFARIGVKSHLAEWRIKLVEEAQQQIQNKQENTNEVYAF